MSGAVGSGREWSPSRQRESHQNHMMALLRESADPVSRVKINDYLKDHGTLLVRSERF